MSKTGVHFQNCTELYNYFDDFEEENTLHFYICWPDHEIHGTFEHISISV